MAKQIGSSPTWDREREATGHRWWLGLISVAVVLLLAIILLGAPSWALPVEQVPAAPDGSPHPAVVSPSIAVHVLLEARPAPPTSSWAIPLQVKLYYANGTVYTQTVVMTDDGGNFFLNGIPENTYDVWVKGAHTLAERQNNISISNALTVHLEFGPLAEGDANNDNQIGAIDASFLSNGYWKMEGQAGFVTGADFNEDGISDARDASLLASHYGLAGE